MTALLKSNSIVQISKEIKLTQIRSYDLFTVVESFLKSTKKISDRLESCKPFSN